LIVVTNLSKTHSVIASVYKQHFTCYSTPRITQEEQRRICYFTGIDVAPQRRMSTVNRQNIGETRNAARG